MKEYSESSFEGLASNLNVHQWALEGYNKAIEDIYPFVKGSNKIT